MLLGFKERFVERILAGEKRHTIRATRKIPPRVGEVCHCYTGLRQKGARLLGRWPCIKVEEIEILPWNIHDKRARSGVFIGGQNLSADERDALAIRDGFPGGFPDMMRFWDGRLPFTGVIIHWDFDHPVEVGRTYLRQGPWRTTPAGRLALAIATTRGILE